MTWCIQKMGGRQWRKSAVSEAVGKMGEEREHCKRRAVSWEHFRPTELASLQDTKGSVNGSPKLEKTGTAGGIVIQQFGHRMIWVKHKAWQGIRLKAGAGNDKRVNEGGRRGKRHSIGMDRRQSRSGYVAEQWAVQRWAHLAEQRWVHFVGQKQAQVAEHLAEHLAEHKQAQLAEQLAEQWRVYLAKQSAEQKQAHLVEQRTGKVNRHSGPCHAVGGGNPVDGADKVADSGGVDKTTLQNPIGGGAASASSGIKGGSVVVEGRAQNQNEKDSQGVGGQY